MIGIYIIVNGVNGHRYIGCSANIEKRWMEHKAKRVRKNKTRIGRAFWDFGTENFSMQVLQECTVDQLAEMETLWITQLHPEYNMNAGGFRWAYIEQVHA